MGLTYMQCKRLVPVVGSAILFLAACDGGGGIGDGSEINAVWPDHVYTTPTRLPTTLSFDKIGLGHTHSCMITAAGEAYCWGSNQEGQLGTTSAMQLCSGGTTRCSPTPLRVVGISNVASIDGSVRHTCALSPPATATGAGLLVRNPSPN